MSSYIDFYQDFLQKKETFVGRRVSTVSLPEEQEELDNGQTIHADIINESSKNMEHSYTRDTTIRPPLNEPSTGLAPARTVLVRRPPQCPSCHTHPIEEHELNDGNQAVIPSYNEIAAKEAMNECARIAKYVKNVNSDEENWETRISRNGWSSMQKSLYDKVVNILDNDHLGRLSNFGRQNEVMQRRVLTDKSASRMRKALASVAWDSRLTQWLHCLLMDYLPSTYMASYLDILQTLKTKVPSLIDKMLFMRPLNVSQELLAPVMKKQWEPLINTKARILTHNVIIVALPSLPYGSIPRRIQKWYQHLAGITQILQITLPTTGGHTAQQPINQVAEQIVSLTRVKLQELKHENSSRSIILIGFGAGSALALQVAMSESIAAVICMGFAYNTLKGVRGKPDDRILDIKIPILFVIGQNSQRTSSEEIESLREKMQSESSLVIVGSADDMLRVPKSRRKIENVTQSMIDAMVVDEVFEFMKKILTNPPGPRIPTAIVNTSFNRHSKTNLTNDGKIVSTSRKRKQDGTIETESTAAKSKFCPQIGRPRTRPIPSTAPVAKTAKVYTPTSLQSATNDSTSTTLTNEDLNIAIQSILQEPATEGTTDSTSPSIIDNTQKKIVTNFELVAQPKSANTPNSFLNINNTMGTKIRMIPPNQFLQLKPPLQSQSKIYTIKTTPTQTTQQSGGTCNIGSIVNTSAASTINSAQQQHIFTLKSPNGQTTQFVTAAPPAAQQKYTVLKNAAGGTTLQLTRTSVLKNQSMETSNVDIPNIIDMPIVFADHEGNIADSVDNNTDGNKESSSNPTTKPNIGQLIINQKLAKDSSTSAPLSPNLPKGGGTFVIGRPTTSLQQSTIIQTGQLTSKPNKVLFINRNTMKPCSNIIGQTSGSTQKFAKVLVTNPKLSNGGSIVSRPSIILTTSANTPTLSSSSIVSNVKKFNFQTLKSNVSGSKPTSGILNVSTKSIPQVQIINAAPGSSTTIGSNVIGQSSNVNQLSDRPQVRNIVVKAGGLKQVSPQLTSQLLNRNLTVRKLVNIVPVTKPTTVTAGGNVTISSPQASQTTPEEGSNISTISNSNLTLISSIQSSPKIFTLNQVSTTAEPESTQNVQ